MPDSELKTYEDYGYDNKMMKGDQRGDTSFSVDSSLNNAGFDASVMSGGEIRGDLIITSGRLIIKDDLGETIIGNLE